MKKKIKVTLQAVIKQGPKNTRFLIIYNNKPASQAFNIQSIL